MTIQQLTLLSFKVGPTNFATSEISVLRQELAFFVSLFTSIAKRFMFNEAGFMDPSLDCDEFVF